MACHVNRCYYYQHGIHYPRQSQIVTCCYISHKATDMFERNEQPGSAERPGRPTDRPTNRSNNNIYISVPGCPIKRSTHGSYRLHLTTNIFRSLVFYVGYQNKSQEYLPSVPLRLSTAQPRHPLNGAMHPPPTSCKECPTHPPMLTADFLGLELPTAPFPAGTPSHEGQINVSF